MCRCLLSLVRKSLFVVCCLLSVVYCSSFCLCVVCSVWLSIVVCCLFGCYSLRVVRCLLFGVFRVCCVLRRLRCGGCCWLFVVCGSLFVGFAYCSLLLVVYGSRLFLVGCCMFVVGCVCLLFLALVSYVLMCLLFVVC